MKVDHGIVEADLGPADPGPVLLPEPTNTEHMIRWSWKGFQKNVDKIFYNFSLVPVISCILITFGYACGLGPVPFILFGELFPNRWKRVWCKSTIHQTQFISVDNQEFSPVCAVLPPPLPPFSGASRSSSPSRQLSCSTFFFPLMGLSRYHIPSFHIFRKFPIFSDLPIIAVALWHWRVIPLMCSRVCLCYWYLSLSRATLLIMITSQSISTIDDLACQL